MKGSVVIKKIASLGFLGRRNEIPAAVKAFNELSVPAGDSAINVQSFGGWWWYGGIFNYDPACRDRLMHKSGGYFDVTGATTIDHKKAKTLHDRGVKFVDVREAKSFADGHVPGAFNLDIDTEFSRESLSRIVGKDEEFVLFCYGKTCPSSAYASAKAVMWGFKRVYYFSGGFPAWKEAGYPVEVSPTN